MPYLDPAAAGAPDLEVVLLNWNGRELLRRGLEGIFALEPRSRVLISVVDNASTDGSQAMLRQAFPGRLNLIESSENLGFARGNNLALRRSDARHVLLLNSDARPLPDGGAEHPFDRLVGYLDLHPEVGALGPRIVRPGGGVEDSTGERVSLFNLLKRRLLRLARLPRRWSGRFSMSLWTYDRERDVDWATAAALAVRGEVLRAGCFLDEGYFMYGEDVEWCHRIRALGYRVRFWPGVVFEHLGHGSDPAPADRRRRRRLHREGLLRFVELHPTWGAPLLKALLRGSLAALKRR
jgi:hypothetical protein